MAQPLRTDHVSDYEAASRTLLRRLAEMTDQMEAAEPGTDDFLVAYNESRRLREMYRQVRDQWSVPYDVQLALEVDEPAPGTERWPARG